MNDILLIVIMAIFIMSLIMVASTWYVNFIMRNFIGDKHHVIEEIINTGKVPKDWSNKFEKKIKKLQQSENNKQQIYIIRQKARASYLTKLEELIKYIKTTKLVENEDIRKELLEELKMFCRLWKESIENAI